MKRENWKNFLERLTPKTKSMRYMVIAIVILLAYVLVMAYFSRGVIRSSAIPGVYTKLYSKSIDDAFKTQSAYWTNPASSPFHTIEESEAKCIREFAQDVRVSMSCNRLLRQKTAIKEDELADFSKSLATIYEKMTKDGWKGEVWSGDQRPAGPLGLRSREQGSIWLTKIIDGFYCSLQFDINPGYTSDYDVTMQQYCSKSAYFIGHPAG